MSKKNLDLDYNNKKGSNSTADNSDNATKIIYHVKNPKQSFQIKKNKSTINLENYKIIRKIGQGSFGQIFEIEDNLKNKYALKKIIVTQESDIKKIEEEQNQEDLNIPRHDFNLNNLENFCFKLKEAEDALRKSELEGDPKYDIEAIDKYNLIRNETLYQGVPLEAIYFNKKCIDIAKKNGHTESLIKSLIYMGDCFDKTNLPADMNISKRLKEEAKDIYKEKLDGKNCPYMSWAARVLH